MIEDAKTLLDAGKQLAGITYIQPDSGAPVVFDSNGQAHVLEAEQVEAWAEFPTRKRGNQNFADADSSSVSSTSTKKTAP